eukprot:CCRYP_009282-RC/>CCRYP_009282-RC protein AED:0.46 eAED:1.00 QI:0/0/0/1/0/0/2/0/103
MTRSDICRTPNSLERKLLAAERRQPECYFPRNGERIQVNNRQRSRQPCQRGQSTYSGCEEHRNRQPFWPTEAKNKLAISLQMVKPSVRVKQAGLVLWHWRRSR